ncbi:hypothetical protein [Dyadobacter sp. BHUBP1]|uniref:hypothetical protein n=1 Tax=Dyadobacter sp. BHUBP1 TaxID=3424178 RepID=UPI003D3377CE
MSTLQNEHEIIKAFFQTDSASEIINSLNFMVESLLAPDGASFYHVSLRSL